MGRKLKVLFLPLEGVGHVNACVSLAQELIRCGHNVSFALKEGWRGKLEKYGIEEVLLKSEDESNKLGDNTMRGERMVISGEIGSKTPLEKAKSNGFGNHRRVDSRIKLDKVVEKLLTDICPEVIIVDQFYTIPSVVTSGIPWIWCSSPGPLCLYGIEEEMPPSHSGLANFLDL